MKARTTLLELFRESREWRAFFRSCCESSAFRLRSQAWQFREKLKERGHGFLTEEVEDSLLGLARELLPDTPAAHWDAEWTHELCKDALAHLAKRYTELSTDEKEAVDFSGQDVWDERMHAAGLANDPIAFRTALDGWTLGGARSYGRVTNQRRCRMSSSSGTDSLSLAKGGPVTQEGKEVARWNATRHGIRSSAPVVPGVEKKADWEEHRDGILESLQPEGHLELVLAERVALLSWRLHRVIRYETESIALFQEKAENDLADRRRFANRVLGAAHPEDVRSNLKMARSDYRLLKRFPKLKDDKHLSSFDADRVLWAVMEVTDRVEEGDIAPEDLLEEISIPGVPENTIEWEDYDGWSAGAVRASIEAVATATNEDPKELVELATDAARRDIIGKEQAAEQVERDLQRMSRERLLPDEKTLEKVARYEAHLSRGLYKAMHELEALQARRTGGAAPLARLDVDGLAGS